MPSFSPPRAIAVFVFGCIASLTIAQDSRPASGPADPTLPKNLWVDATDLTIGKTAEWTNKVEAADVNEDGLIDILFANGGDYEKPGTAVPTRVFLNHGPGEKFTDATKAILGDALMFARVVKVRDLNADGHPDIVVGTTFGTQSRFWMSTGGGKFVESTKSHFPAILGNVGDIEFGDVDMDGDLDMALAEWGDGSPMKNEGGKTMLWLNDGRGHFSDATATHMPTTLVRFSWELECVDIDNDFDLDLVVSSKKSKGSSLFENDGTGHFKDVSEGRMPQHTNNYEFEAMDLTGDGFLDLLTINDGPRFTEQIFVNDRKGGFKNETAERWQKSENPSHDDNMIAYLDYDSDGDADFVIGSLDGPDRLLINDGTGHFRCAREVFTGAKTPATLGIVLADVDGDGRLDCIHAQGEVPNCLEEKVFLGKGLVPDIAGPWIGPGKVVAEKFGGAANGRVSVVARIHDRKSPAMPHDFKKVQLVVNDGGTTREYPMTWYGEYLWRATIDRPEAATWTYSFAATDAAGNETKSQPANATK